MFVYVLAFWYRKENVFLLEYFHGEGWVLFHFLTSAADLTEPPLISHLLPGMQIRTESSPLNQELYFVMGHGIMWFHTCKHEGLVFVVQQKYTHICGNSECNIKMLCFCCHIHCYLAMYTFKNHNCKAWPDCCFPMPFFSTWRIYFPSSGSFLFCDYPNKEHEVLIVQLPSCPDASHTPAAVYSYPPYPRHYSKSFTLCILKAVNCYYCYSFFLLCLVTWVWDRGLCIIEDILITTTFYLMAYIVVTITLPSESIPWNPLSITLTTA